MEWHFSISLLLLLLLLGIESRIEIGSKSDSWHRAYSKIRYACIFECVKVDTWDYQEIKKNARIILKTFLGDSVKDEQTEKIHQVSHFHLNKKVCAQKEGVSVKNAPRPELYILAFSAQQQQDFCGPENDTPPPPLYTCTTPTQSFANFFSPRGDAGEWKIAPSPPGFQKAEETL